MRGLRALCVLGCRPGSPALARRTRAARDAWIEHGSPLVVACGGRAWSGRVEADEIARMLADGGVPDAAIVRERFSIDTRGNARFAAELLERRGIKDVVVVTCSWHLPRALGLFEASGLRAVGVGAPPPSPENLPWTSRVERLWWSARERVATWKDLGRR